MPTYFDVGLRGSAESWRALRRRRAAQLVPGPNVNRAETFRSSLEQAEQQFAAAAVVGYDSRALNLFYGLSQAERAIAATAAPNGAWELRGHGIRTLEEDVSDVLAVRLKPSKAGDSGNFVRMSELLGSDLPGPFTLGQVWPLLVETVLHERPESSTPAPLFVTVNDRSVPNDGVSVIAAELSLKDARVPPGGRWWETEPCSLEEFLARYPQLCGWEPRLPSGAPVDWPQPPSTQLSLRWSATELSGGADALRGRLTLYRGRRTAYPVLDGRPAVMHPLLAWHAVLFGLSILTRYGPARWTRMIDVDHSRQATLIEYVLDLALDAVPDLVDEAIETFTQDLVVIGGSSEPRRAGGEQVADLARRHRPTPGLPTHPSRVVLARWSVVRQRRAGTRNAWQRAVGCARRSWPPVRALN